ncbi:DUF5994 family protein [Nocardioides convexus]|uniref:DUF5994 family protein n=1 Tax=Nocardioides convexus TaxID=2712224 RepID=UPI002418785A|nr:DUF5994 family protein [Nocardioides convexus]
MATPATRSDRVPLRLAVADGVHAGPLDGAWWPQSRDLAVEGADLVDHFPDPVGHVARLLYSRPDWEPDASGAALRKIRARRGPVKVGSFPSDDTHVMVAVLSSGVRLRLVVVPSVFGDHEAARVMSAAADEANRRTAGEPPAGGRS